MAECCCSAIRRRLLCYNHPACIKYMNTFAAKNGIPDNTIVICLKNNMNILASLSYKIHPRRSQPLHSTTMHRLPRSIFYSALHSTALAQYSRDHQCYYHSSSRAILVSIFIPLNESVQEGPFPVRGWLLWFRKPARTEGE